MKQASELLILGDLARRALKRRIFLLGGIVFCMVPNALFPQQILNGSFESNDLDCGFNMGNNFFNSHVPNITAYGGQSEIDLLSSLCNYNQAVDGDYFIGMYNFHFSDEIAFDLTQPLQPGKLYKLSFAARLGTGIFNLNTKVEIGLSDAADAFGKSVGYTGILDTIWHYYHVQFSPEALYDRLTVRVGSVDESWVFLDGFALECPSINLGNDTAYCDIRNILLDAGNYFESYQWSDLSSGTTLEVTEPGTYWVAVQDGNCVTRDTILIQELPFNCNCNIYIPNVFTPNDDGQNDTFLPRTPCAVLDYKLRIFDRWGRQVFVATDPDDAWNGTYRGKSLTPGVYAYALAYRFYYQDKPVYATGDVTIVR